MTKRKALRGASPGLGGTPLARSSRRDWCLGAAAWGVGLCTGLSALPLAHATPRSLMARLPGWEPESSAGPLGCSQGGVGPGYALALADRWELFKARFTRTAGAGELRVVDLANAGVSHSEGQGVGMLVAQATGDRASFEALWRFCQRMRNAQGLLAWRWEPAHGVQRDPNNASDGDLYVAWALALAGSRWARPEWTSAAGQILLALRTHCVKESRSKAVLLPGAVGFDSPDLVANPSYWVLPALKDLGKLDEPAIWAKVGRDSLSLMAALRFGPQQLPADWAVLTDPAVPWPQRPARFGYEAIRVPLFLAWAEERRHPALLSCAAALRSPGFAAWQSLTGPERAGWLAPAGFEAIACLVRTAVFGQPLRLANIDDDYYSSSLTLLTCLALSDLRISEGDTAIRVTRATPRATSSPTATGRTTC